MERMIKYVNFKTSKLYLLWCLLDGWGSQLHPYFFLPNFLNNEVTFAKIYEKLPNYIVFCDGENAIKLTFICKFFIIIKIIWSCLHLPKNSKPPFPPLRNPQIGTPAMMSFPFTRLTSKEIYWNWQLWWTKSKFFWIKSYLWFGFVSSENTNN